MNRIKSILFFINKEDKVVDVGCDSAKLGILLAKRGQKSIASDISENVINKTKEEIKKLKLDDFIDVRLSNGLENITEEETDTLVLTGLGTYTIINILEDTKIKFKKIITISNNNHDMLREKMNKLGYVIDKEQIIRERNKYYNLILFIPGKTNYNEKELLLGKNHIDNFLYEQYLSYLLNKYQKIKIKSKNNNLKINKYIKYINEELSYIKN